METIFAYSAAAVLLFVSFVFLIAQWKKDNGIMDIAWGLGFCLVAIVGLMESEAISGRQILLTTLVFLWGIRLSAYIYSRNKGKGEDFRYRKWREEWGRHVAVRSFFQVFMLQGLIMWVIALPILFVNVAVETELFWVDFAGLAIWLTGFYFEAVGDYQMQQFRKNPANKGKICTTGLWKYTRHPNYFGEVTMWWGIFIISIPAGYWWFSIISPLLITFLILKVSGVTMLEKKYEGNPEFREYASKTSAFFPWFPG